MGTLEIAVLLAWELDFEEGRPQIVDFKNKKNPSKFCLPLFFQFLSDLLSEWVRNGPS